MSIVSVVWRPRPSDTILRQTRGTAAHPWLGRKAPWPGMCRQGTSPSHRGRSRQELIDDHRPVHVPDRPEATDLPQRAAGRAAGTAGSRRRWPRSPATTGVRPSPRRRRSTTPRPGESIRWGVRLDAPAAANAWAINLEVHDAGLAGPLARVPPARRGRVRRGALLLHLRPPARRPEVLRRRLGGGPGASLRRLGAERARRRRRSSAAATAATSPTTAAASTRRCR